MGFQDRRYRDPDFGEGGFMRALRRIFVEGDNVFGWSIPFYTAMGIAVRIHLLYIVVIIVRLFSPVQPGVIGFWYTAFFLASMFVFVLLHEYGHCFAARWTGGDADRILMWPLGGLASARPPHTWKANLITTIAGPGVNVALAALFAGIMLVLGAGTGTVAINLLKPWSAYATEAWFNYPAAHWKILLFSCYVANIYMALFNLLLPMYPMDCGRILEAIIWSRTGYKKAHTIMVNVGLFTAVLVGSFAIMTELMVLFMIAFFCGVTCFNERRMLGMVDDDFMGAGSEQKYQIGPTRAQQREADRKYQGALKAQQREQSKQAELDRILGKIAGTGMDSLSRKEKAFLQEATERKRASGF